MAGIDARLAKSDEPMHVRMIVNGLLRELTGEPRMTLLDALRDELALTGPKKSSDRGGVRGMCCPYGRPPSSLVHDPGGNA